MSIEVLDAKVSDKSVIRNMLELYQYEMSAFEDTDLDEHGLYGYAYLDGYWTDSTRFPFLIRVDGHLAGFALVNQYSCAGLALDKAMAEFFVLLKYRRLGIGRHVAQRLFRRFTGQWEVAVLERNTAAQAFWRAVIAQHSTGEYEQVDRCDGLPGPVLRFRS